MSKIYWALRSVAPTDRAPIHRAARICATMFCMAALSACSGPGGPIVSGYDPSDPHAPIAGVGYRSTIAPYESMRPVAPGNWRQQNQNVGPQPKAAP
jgi:hypothetical protein